ncbi:hypothetical protein EDB85DRAFT_1950803 [Lactarius pseudohatsudake]|nr:hypothetical protein EDB85DRAFT_1950803 [Lactarius pseudohatsudake]
MRLYASVKLSVLSRPLPPVYLKGRVCFPLLLSDVSLISVQQVQMESQWTIPLADPQNRHGNPPTVERLDPTFQPNMPAYQQGEGVTTQNCTCPRCSELQRTQSRPMTSYPIEQQDPRHFGNVDAPHLNQDQNVDNRVPDRVWAPQTTVIQYNNGYPPVPEGAGPPQALLLDASIAESRRRLAGRYLNNPDVYVSTIRLEPGPDGELQVIITLGIANVL